MGLLKAYVHVGGVVYAPGDEVPAHHARLITNPKAWDGEVPAPGDASSPVPPPRAGKGSGRDEWAAYASALGVDVDVSASRDDIIAAVDTA